MDARGCPDDARNPTGLVEAVALVCGLVAVDREHRVDRVRGRIGSLLPIASIGGWLSVESITAAVLVVGDVLPVAAIGDDGVLIRLPARSPVSEVRARVPR